MEYISAKWSKFLATGASAVLAASIIVPAASANGAATAAFTDVAPQYETAVNYVTAHDLSQGLTDTRYGVSETIKRGDAAIILARALGLQGIAAPDSGFPDVPARGIPEINLLKAAGIANGKSDTHFGFNDTLTRGEVALFLARAYDLQGNAETVEFTDVNGRYAESVAGLVAHGITDGRSETEYGTDEPILRGEFAVFIHRAETLAMDGNLVTGLVAEVSDITEGSVTVRLNEGIEAQEAAVIEVRDPDGKVIPVVPRAIEAGAETAVFEFEVALSEVQYGTWNVDGVEFRTGVSVILGDINTVTNELELKAALASPYFEHVNEHFFTAYFEAMTDLEFDSIEEVQAVIDRANGEIDLGERRAAAVEAVNEADGLDELDLALRNELVERYCEHWTADYQQELASGADSIEDIQAAVDRVNAANIQPVVESALSGLSESEIADARFLVETFMKPDSINSELTPKQDMLDALAVQRVLIDVNESSDETTLAAAFAVLGETSGGFEFDSANETVMPEYFEVISGRKIASVEELNDAVSTINAQVEQEAVAQIDGITSDTSTAQLHELFVLLDYRSAFAGGDFVLEDVDEALLEQYLEAFIDADIESAADVADVVRNVKG